ncbi:MAG: hypothetical protein ACXVA9_05270 [Bdellovibrionales bacterium]
MKKYIVLLVSLLTFGGAAHAGQWSKFLSCASDVGTLVVDRDSDHLDSMQIVITGQNAVNVIANGLQGNSNSLPPNLHLYEDGNKLVISDLTMTANFNPMEPNEYLTYVAEGAANMAVLKYWIGSEINSQANYRFYNCSR